LIFFCTGEEGGNFEFIGSDSVEWGEKATEYMVAATEGGGAFEAKDIGCVFDDAKEGFVAGAVAADFAEAVFGKEAAFGARNDLGAGLANGVGEVFGGAWRCREEVEGESLSGAWAEAGEFAESGDKAKGGGRVISHPVLLGD
jgi:hypothetical protein